MGTGSWFAQVQSQDNQALDPKKTQNIAILLKALNVTTKEVCEALLEAMQSSTRVEFEGRVFLVSHGLISGLNRSIENG
ncbi:hypothetical protein Leryth_025392 [Lithospermum erythrorhizon]|nr:hypothetical protein Leryth_025392 [Lithospermum erythrorhizon]